MHRVLFTFALMLIGLPSQAEVKLYFVHSDHLGTPQTITDDQKAVAWKASYRPYGRTEVQIENIANHKRFPGQRVDIETGLHQNYFRDYDPSLGRYIQSDPVGLLGGMNTYSYVLGNPISGSDPDGLTPTFAFRGGQLFVAGVNRGLMHLTGVTLSTLLLDSLMVDYSFEGDFPDEDAANDSDGRKQHEQCLFDCGRQFSTDNNICNGHEPPDEDGNCPPPSDLDESTRQTCLMFARLKYQNCRSRC